MHCDNTKNLTISFKLNFLNLFTKIKLEHFFLNFYYNIVLENEFYLQFITLENRDERSRLVPVLDTILKLSPEETHKLNSIVTDAENGGMIFYFIE